MNSEARFSNRPTSNSLLLSFLILAAFFLVSLSYISSLSLRVAALALVGIGLGFVLFQSTFGFAGSFRAVLERGDASGFKAQAVALGVSSMIFFPLLATGSVFGQELSGFNSAIGVTFLVGALMFGFGMQIGGGCASGTLFALGGGNLKLAVTLLFFVAGSAIGAAQIHLWSPLPSLPARTAQFYLGWKFALAVQLMILAAVYYWAPGKSPAFSAQAEHRQKGYLKPWPLLSGALSLAVLNGFTLILAGRPWGETAGFALWGSKVAILLGIDAATWPYWKGNPAPLAASVFSDITSVMDFGIVLGASLAACLSGRFALKYNHRPGAWLGASLGGVLMGYGARLSGGCNIGAYFSALASGSLSAWVWVAAAFVGSWIGLRFRSMFSIGS
jgi:hypothetical protein